MRLFLLFVALSLLATRCAAQPVFACGVNGSPLTVLGGVPFMGFTPPAPNSSQAVTITVGMSNFNPMGAVAVVQGNVINVTFTASFLGFATLPALSCSTGNVGPLSAGSYIVNLFVVDPGVPNPTAIQTAIGTLAVGAALTPIPTLSNVALATLTLLLSLAEWHYVRRHSTASSRR
jgi:hypothetical protein